MATKASSTADTSRPAASAGLVEAIKTQEGIVLSLTVLLLVLFTALLDDFLAPENLFNLFYNVSLIGILAIGMGIVVIGRGIDLSQIAIMGVTSAFVLHLLANGVSMPVALVLAGLLAVGFGLLNGVVIAFVEIPALFATLASAFLFFGFGLVFLVDGALQYLPAEHQGLIAVAQGRLFGIPLPALIFLALLAIVQFGLKRTVAGYYLYAQGDSYEAARISGVPVRMMVVAAYTLGAAIAFLGGMIFAAASAAVDMRVVQSTMIFDVILVVVLGGISLVGGRGSMWSVLAGALLIATLLNGMIVLNVNSDVQDIIKGLVLVGAVLLDRALHPVDEETAKQGDTL